MSKIANISASFKGTTQAQSILPALNPDAFKVDGRDTADFLAFTVKFAKAFQYFNPQNQKDGNWQQILLSDQTMLLAYIMKTDHPMEFSRFLDYRDGIMVCTDYNTKKLFTQQFFSIGFHIILRINRWYKLSNQSINHHPFRDYLDDLIRAEGRLALRNYYQIYFSLCEWKDGFKNEAFAKLEDLDRVWMFEPFPCIPDKEVSLLPGIEIPLPHPIEKQVNLAVVAGQTLFHLQEKIIKSAADYFESSIEKSKVTPHIGLMLSFLDLLKYQQADLNQLTTSHLDFYFNSILGFKALEAEADATFVAFQLANGYSSFPLPAETALSAGNDAAGTPITFSTQTALTLTSGTISQYLTLNFEQQLNKLGIPTLPELYSGTLKKYDDIPAQSWPFFGATHSANPNYTVKKTKDALGFAFSCPDLLLAGGERDITFSLYNQIIPSEVLAPDFTLILEPIFNFQLTTSKGWTTFEGQNLHINKTESYVQFSIPFSTSDPAITAYDKKIHGPGFDTSWPICKVSIAKGIFVSDFDFLSSFSFKKISITSNVQGTENLTLQTDRGKASPTVPFLPFGNTPFPGANLFIGSQEMFAKSLSNFKLNILWENLPEDFSVYYKQYPDYYENQSFLANLSFLNAQEKWQALKVENRHKLFSLFTKDFFLSPSDLKKLKSNPELWPIVIPIDNPRNIDFDKINIPPQPKLPPILAFNQETSSAFFKLTFQAPSQGFGSNEYPKLVSKITLENGQAIIWNAKNCSNVKPPIKPGDICDALLKVQGQLDHLKSVYVHEIMKIDQVETVLNKSVAEITEILEDCKTKNACIALVKNQLNTDLESIQSIFLNQQNNTASILQRAFHLYDQFLQNNSEALKEIGKEKTKDTKEKTEDTNKKETEKHPKNILENVITTATKTLLSPLGGKLAEYGIKVFDGLKHKLLSGIEDKLEDKLEGKLKEEATKVKRGWFDFLKRKKKSSALPEATKTDGKKDESKTDNPINEIEDLIKEVNAISTLVIKSFVQCSDKLIGLLSHTTENEPTSSPIAPGASIKYQACLQKINAILDGYKNQALVYEGIFSTINQFFKEWIAKEQCECIPLQPLPNKPFVPKIKSLSMDYQSKSQWGTDDSFESDPLSFKFYHIAPFGNKAIKVNQQALNLLPDYKNVPYTILGLKNVNPGDTLTILINITSQSALLDAQVDKNIQYGYLSENGWQNLSLSSDGTFELKQTGIIRFKTPMDMTNQSTEMPAGYFWLRISNHRTSLDLQNNCEVISTNFLSTQAIAVKRILINQVDIQHIPAGTIKAPVIPIKAIKKILQPQTSSGGRAEENIAETNQRTAYRLRNKNRAVNYDDMEALLLQAFKNLYKVTTIPMAYYNDEDSKLTKTILVPFTETNSKHPYRPLLKPATLKDILDYGQQRCPPAIELEMVNADFLVIAVIVNVTFINTNESGLLRKQLNAELMDYLSPWYKGRTVGDQLGDEWNLTKLQAFILSRSYITSVSDLYFIQTPDETCMLLEDETSADYTIECVPINMNLDQNLSPWKLLVPAFQHYIFETSKDTSSKITAAPGTTAQSFSSITVMP